MNIWHRTISNSGKNHSLRFYIVRFLIIQHSFFVKSCSRIELLVLHTSETRNVFTHVDALRNFHYKQASTFLIQHGRLYYLE